MDAVILPERLLGAIVAGMRTQLADDGALRGFLTRQRYEDAAAFIPFPDNGSFLYFSDRFDNHIAVTAWMLEGGKGRTDFITNILIAGRKLVAENMKQREVNLIGAVSVGGMNI